ncbi:MAG: hypothetical protein ABI091_29470, partial [Ferruginibacter sp.]
DLIITFFKIYMDDGKFTAKFIGVAGLLYLASFLLLNGLLSFGFFLMPSVNQKLDLGYLSLGTIAVAAILTFHKLNKKFPFYLIIVISILFYNSLTSYDWKNTVLKNMGDTLTIYVYFSVALFCIWINMIITKWNLKKLINKKSAWLIIPSFLANIVVLLLIVILTVRIQFLIDFGTINPDNNNNDGIIVLLFLGPVFLLVLLTNSVFIILFLLILINQLIWPLISAPIRALYEHKLIQKRGVLFAIGLLFINLSNLQILENPIVKLIKDLFK